ncbi:MAG: hypothetical protein L3J41_08380 [Melioribacteraceae bacterium]|nr:hypothetical protein [Melioribacteraceae bacterium]
MINLKFYLIVIHKKIVNDENGKPSDVIIPWSEFKQIEEMLGLDFDKESVEDLKIAKSDREKTLTENYISLDNL